jgi:hypothetical protein
MSKLVSMARTKAEIKAREDRYKPGASPSMSENPYPYGLTIRLEAESLKKLGAKIGDYAIGDTVRIVCECEVSELRQNNTKTNSEACVEFQIEKMALEDRGMAGALDSGIAEADDE